jgi:hypothetical protein
LLAIRGTRPPPALPRLKKISRDFLQVPRFPESLPPVFGELPFEFREGQPLPLRDRRKWNAASPKIANFIQRFRRKDLRP